MQKTYTDLNPTERVLLGPGPSMAAPRVIRTMATPPVGHLDPALLKIYTEEQELLRHVFNTNNEWTFALSGTGTSAMEAAMANLIEPGDPVLVAMIGYFGSRLAEIASRLGGEVDTIERPLGEIFPVEEIETALKAKSYKVFGLVHAETSTGAEQLHVGEIVKAAHEQGALVVLDTVTSLGSIPVLVDEWDIDVTYSASQKSLSAPSGLAPITVSARAQEFIQNRKTPVSSFYLDLNLYANYWGNHGYHHTASASLHYALREALRVAYEEGLDARYARHRANAELLWAGLEEIGVPPFIPAEYRLPPLTTAIVPEGVDPHALRAKLLNEYNIEIAGGFGTLADKVWRIGLMGYSSRKENITLLLAALRELI
ncbi:MAG: aminotransferase class V-fold PLP-dependent enzyme [Anaerolineae bacterium]|jgi:alanine-glyoxylate transaminase / serine-glyoxylate transaminase / serine-pyruvate transaminase|nr:aminotransferase class V-fold PLP-dependent enzyme [Anaerolineae bacterium]MBT4311505.1 aminotransferase class V-fold PLP-dependent enzyme [Anaerolineae bacterium]MBT4456787.1 aminotransferase class V-fold PLP-dependent enzyme [Anaerolineae bacterium]MBT6062768.1 aminotransferase class V-fold PLP-dependent enzyme [Anaerolineae bacterium]MBT6813146.1 aminotransferase class V-fold PLP-dependent enzyme [Anaerolineae bacterium]